MSILTHTVPERGSDWKISWSGCSASCSVIWAARALICSTTAALALALGADPGRLLGIAPPEQDTAGAEQLHRAVHALDLPDFAEPAEVLALPELHGAASGAWSDYLAGRHTELLAGLPALMIGAHTA